MITKFEAVEHFEFVKETNKRGSLNDKLCGVFFDREYAYCLNDPLLGRVKIRNDFPRSGFEFWSYGDGETIITDEKFATNFKGYCDPNFFRQGLRKAFNIKADNCIFIERKKLQQILEDCMVQEKKMKTKIFLEMSLNHSEIKLKLTNDKRKPIMSSIIPFRTSSLEAVSVNPLNFFIVNAFYLQKILSSSLYLYDIIVIRFNTEKPVVIFGKSSLRPEIYWLVAQANMKLKL